MPRPLASLSIVPPSPGHSSGTNLTTPVSSYSPSLLSPRRAPFPPSSAGMVDERASFDMPPPPVPSKDVRRAITIHGPPPASPSSQRKNSAVGVYDQKLVSSTLSQLPPLPPLSPRHPQATQATPSLSSATPNLPSSISIRPSMSSLSAPNSHSSMTNNSALHPTSSSGVVLPDGTTLLPHSRSVSGLGMSGQGSTGGSQHPSHPSSPWSLLQVHVLPIFAGSPLKSAVEDLNQLSHSHIAATASRVPASRLIAVLSSDLRDFIASGMLTLKAKLETLDDAKVVSRVAEVWVFFWSQVLPYVEGVFLPFSQVRDLSVPVASTSSTSLGNASRQAEPPISVRHLLLSGFLLHILLPFLPRLHSLLEASNTSASSMSPYDTAQLPAPTPNDLSRLQQMALVLSTQARYSSFFPSREKEESARRDQETREAVESLAKAVRIKSMPPLFSAPSTPTASASGSPVSANWVDPRRSMRQSYLGSSGPAVSAAGKYRRRGWRASSTMGVVSPTKSAFQQPPPPAPRPRSGSETGSRVVLPQRSDSTSTSVFEDTPTDSFTVPPGNTYGTSLSLTPMPSAVHDSGLGQSATPQPAGYRQLSHRGHHHPHESEHTPTVSGISEQQDRERRDRGREQEMEVRRLQGELWGMVGQREAR